MTNFIAANQPINKDLNVGYLRVIINYVGNICKLVNLKLRIRVYYYKTYYITDGGRWFWIIGKEYATKLYITFGAWHISIYVSSFLFVERSVGMTTNIIILIMDLC